MDRWICIALLGSLALISEVSSETEINVQITQRYASPGENITITCEITNFPAGGAAFFTKTAAEGVFEPLSANNAILGDYKSSGRFVFNDQPIDNIAYFKLAIHNVRYEDSARYSCVTAQDLDQASATFEVYRNTEHLAFYVNGTEVQKDELVDLEEGEPMPINCTAARAVPYPKIYILSRDRDITDRFSESHHVVPDCVGLPNCLLHFYYNASKYNSMYKASWAENGQQMKCKAIIEEQAEEYHHGYDVVETHIRLNVTHSPVVNCTTNKFYSAIGLTSKTIRCPVYSNPELLSEDISLVTDDNSISLKPGDSNQGITFRFAESTEFSKPGEMQVTWTNVQRKHLTTYRVEASNVIGDRTYKFDLFEEEESGGENPNGSTSVGNISIMCLVLMAVMALFSH